MGAMRRVVVALAMMMVTGAGTPPPTGDEGPVSPAEVVMSASAAAHAPALVLLTEAEMSAVLGAGDLVDEVVCDNYRLVIGVLVGWGWGELAYRVCKVVRS